MEVEVWASMLLWLASVGPGLADKKYLYHIPWTCSVLYTPPGRPPQLGGYLIGACAIIEERKVLVSVDNFREKVPNLDPPKRYHNVLKNVYVNAGTNWMDPVRLRLKPAYLQTRNVSRFAVGFKRPEANGGHWDWRIDPFDISEKKGAEFDVYGLAFNVGILELTEPFFRSAYVLPMPIKPDVAGRTTAYMKKLENAIGLPRNSCITYSWNSEKNTIRYHEVTYLPSRNCQKLFCYWEFSKCSQFPKKDYLMCFKSVKFADVCPNARGAALYCPGFDQSVLAIMTSAPSCGLRHMPGVYTTLPLVIDLFEKAFLTEFKPEKRTPYDVFSLPQKNSDYYGIE